MNAPFLTGMVLDSPSTAAFKVPQPTSLESTPQNDDALALTVLSAVLDGYMDGVTLASFKRRTEQEIARRLDGLKPEEAAVLAFLQERLAREAARQKRIA